MSRRVLFIIFYVICFFIALYAGSNAYRAWGILDDWTRATTILNIVLGFGGVLLAYWIYVDDDRLYDLERKTQNMGN